MTLLASFTWPWSKVEVPEKTAEAIIDEIATVAGGAGTVPELAASVAAFVAKPSAAAVKAADKISAGLPAHEQSVGAYYVKVGPGAASSTAVWS